MDCNLPESLACDLEWSKDSFACRRLTAGAPPAYLGPSSLKPVDYSRCRLVRRPSDNAWNGFQHLDDGGPGPGPDSVHVLWAFDDDDSYSSAELDIPPHPVRCREQSVATIATLATTAATTVTAATTATSGTSTGGLSGPPRKILPPVDARSGTTWLELDSDSDSDDGIPNSDAVAMTPSHRPLPSTHPSELERPRTSSGRASILAPQRPVATIPVPRRRSSLSHRVTIASDESVAQNHNLPSSSQLDLDTTTTPKLDRDISVIRRKAVAIRAEELPADDASDVAPETVFISPMPDRHSDKPMSPRQPIAAEDANPLSDIQIWLESSVDSPPFHSTGAGETIPAAIPIPREIMDNLRHRIDIFPEIMLTPDCYSIETIRSYSRKVRRCDQAVPTHASDEVRSILSGTSSRRRWKLPRVSLKSWRTTPSLSRLQPAWPSGPTAVDDDKKGRDSLCIQRIFPAASAYHCDALYAHILAFNYITALSPSPSAGQRHRPRPSMQVDDDDADVASADGHCDPRFRRPRRANRDKAASLLGIETPQPTRFLPQTPRSSFSELIGGGGGGTQLTPEVEADLREIRLGLASCIRELLRTLKLTTAGRESTRMTDAAVRDVDPVLMRSLCEVVRLREEGIAASTL